MKFDKHKLASQLAPVLAKLRGLRRLGRHDPAAALAAAQGTPIERALAASHELAEELWPRLVGGENVPVRSVLVAAPQRSSGATSVAAACAVRLGAHLREPIGLVELDFERPRLAELLGEPTRVGTAECLHGAADPGASLVHSSRHDHLFVMSGGAPRPLVAGAFAAAAFTRLRHEAETRCRTTIYIAPPLESCHDMRLVAGKVDGVVLVVRAGHTTKEELKSALAMLDESGARLIGTVLSGANSGVPFVSEAA
jgi:Mrp family chromosome partitioning ATPase